MPPRPRCPSCGRLTIDSDVNGTLPSLDGVRPHLVPLLKYAREFDDQTPSNEQYDAVAFVDYLALNAADPGHSKRAGSPGRRKARKAA